MYPHISFYPYTFTAGLTLALLGLAGTPSLTGAAQAVDRSAAQQVSAQTSEVFAATEVNRGSSEKRCPRSPDNSCTKDPFPLPPPPPQ